ncbi:MAG: LruC domain-containing protein [Bacteroidales bacterium]|nr:LruC domain-containing protein [Bacteroidales bacterium]MCF8344129.1 LruC domain-containing protein [Bacteroidales bacterium]MCF8350070.1 LruC domain-containing protein [Bacteroidales bacterium]MCF8374986.1 LruC domain-containing protein [Bacteroidales bacterium]
MKKLITNIFAFSLVILMTGLSARQSRAQGSCAVEKHIADGYYAAIWSVVDNGDNTYTIQIKVRNDGSGGDKEISHSVIEADGGTYSDVSITDHSANFSYGNIDFGPNIGNNWPFQGFKVDGTSGFGNGVVGYFIIEYTLDAPFQDQFVGVKHGPNSDKVKFYPADFQQVLDCMAPTNNPPVAVDDVNSTTVNTAVSGNVITNDSDPDGDDLTVTTTPVADPQHGSVVLNSDGTYTYTPDNGYTGTDTFEYEVCDDNSLCAQATITVTVTGGGGGTDTDGDGVDDDDDDYPDDPDRAFNNYYPAGGNGTLAYEDLWPGKGDYDFNDLVVDYRFNTITNASNLVVEIYGTFIVKAFGASLENGFGFQFPNDNISTQDITVSGFDLQENYISLAGNGLESGQSKPTVIVYDNAFNIMPHPGQGIGVNTEPTAPYVEPDTLNIYMDITDDIYTTAQVDISNFNPFIIVDLTRAREVHLPDYPPTDLADPSYFGTYDDDSDPATGRYYKTQSNLPWAINIYESFEYPIEKREISTAYNHFVEWAESGGVNFQDWYQDNAGYRNDNNIY